LIGLLKGYQGRVAIFGRDLAGWGQSYYERVGVAFELPNHFRKLTALENLAYFSSLYARPTRPPQALLELVGLGEDANTPVAQFSKGMQGRLNLARALLHDPELLFLDEPTSGQDPVNSRRIKELIRAQQLAGKTIFLTTHDMTVAQELCDRVAFIMDGRITLIDTPRALRLHYGQASVRVEYLSNCHTERQEFPLAELADNTTFQSLLRAGTLQTIHSREATLEDVFIRVTGRGLV
ncbi:MAG TPA: ABC transporter ATP-binding protein, partial [Roseiflexaceae bacterium]|nr:ABC transporter ATP-binding protein [Roseiflexaceae bacterium]